MPQIVTVTRHKKRSAVVVGAGPGGLEAARVLSARGHQVTVFEAADTAGGQVRLSAQLQRRREFMGIIDWRVLMCERQGVKFVYNTLADADQVLAENADLVIVATGGLPNTNIIDKGGDIVVSTWDIMSGDVAPAKRVLLFDDNASHPGMAAAEFLARSGAELEIVSPERFFAADVGGMNYAKYAQCFTEHDVRITINTKLTAVVRQDDRLEVTLGSEYSDRTWRRTVDQVVVEHGTLPLDDLYFDLKPTSSNLGEVDYDALTSGREQTTARNADGTFQLFRIGDAVSSRNTHAAIYDALRLCKEF